MSRSYKKVPGFGHRPRKKRELKRFASKAVRRASDVQDGKGYRKLSCSYNICDWWCRIWRSSDAEYKDRIK
jgi:hypothetical protein